MVDMLDISGYTSTSFHSILVYYEIRKYRTGRPSHLLAAGTEYSQTLKVAGTRKTS